MKSTKGIIFEEIQANPTDLLQDLADPELRKCLQFPASAARALRKQQVSRLEENILLLRRKQEEFNRKMEEYIQNIRSLIGSLERSIALQEREGKDTLSRPIQEGTQVRCLSCGEEKTFGELRVLVARDSAESFSHPTEVIVEQDGRIKKGTFTCPQCGNENLLIRKVGA